MRSYRAMGDHSRTRHLGHSMINTAYLGIPINITISTTNLKGYWNNLSSYNQGDIVGYNGGCYCALLDNYQKAPDQFEYWALVATAGINGEPGLTRAVGHYGSNGYSPVGATGISGVAGGVGGTGIGPTGIQGATGGTITGATGGTGGIGATGISPAGSQGI